MFEVVKKSLWDIDLSDNFFDSLRCDYNNFDEWIIKKRNDGYSAYVSYSDDRLGAFLLLKIENSSEDYSDFSKDFVPKKRIKISTFKVLETNKGIGSKFLCIVKDMMRKLNIDYAYITFLKKYSFFEEFLLKNGFQYFCDKNNNGLCECVYVFKRKVSVVMPVKPCYVEKIFSGEKKYEYRKVMPKKNIDKIIIYSTSPVCRVVGEVEVFDIIIDDVYKIWDMTKDYSGISFDNYCKYYKNREKAVAYKLGNVLIYDRPLMLNDLGINYVPQSYIYLD